MNPPNPHGFFQPLISGVAIGPHFSQVLGHIDNGSIGLFVNSPLIAPPNPNARPAGAYLLSNEHVIVHGRAVLNGDDFFSQPGTLYLGVSNAVGPVSTGYQNADDDCALVGPLLRSYNNITYRFINGQWVIIPYYPVVATLAEIVQMAATFTRVFKFGMASSYTEGSVIAYPYNFGGYQNTILIQNLNGLQWAAEGDSGSVCATLDGQSKVVGLNFLGGINAIYEGLAYPAVRELQTLQVQYIAPGAVAHMPRTEAHPASELEKIEDRVSPTLSPHMNMLIEVFNEKKEEVMQMKGITGFGVSSRIIKEKDHHVHSEVGQRESCLIITVAKKYSLSELESAGITPLPKFITSTVHGKIPIWVRKAGPFHNPKPEKMV